MTVLYVPFNKNKPASIELKGHRLLLVSHDSKDLSEKLPDIGGDRIEELELSGDELQQSNQLADLAASISGGIVIAPPGVNINLMLLSLEQQLPWMQ